MENDPPVVAADFRWDFRAAGAGSSRKQEFGFGRKFAEPFSTQPAAEEVGQKQRPALLQGPLLRNGLVARQRVAHLRDGRGDEVAFFVLDADFHRALAAAAREPGDAVEQRGPGG